MNRIAILMLCMAPAAFTQDKALTCDDEGNHGRDRGQYCEMREVIVPAGGHLDIDGGNNGGVSVKGSNRSDILVRSKVQAYDDDPAESRRVAGGVRVAYSGGGAFPRRPPRLGCQLRDPRAATHRSGAAHAQRRHQYLRRTGPYLVR